MSEHKRNIKTSLQENYAFGAIDDYHTKTYILPILLDKRTLSEIVDEHRINPFGMSGRPGIKTKVYSENLARVIDKLRVQATPGKLSLYQKNIDEQFLLVELPTVRGEKIRLLGPTFENRAEGEHEIFKIRINRLLLEYGYDRAFEEC